ncbi:MAG TPA: hypothetical protein DCP63_00900, partial [Bacteroidetes bacterium]|nr:hypothetical protein [Bacteroidota bacterium]
MVIGTSGCGTTTGKVYRIFAEKPMEESRGSVISLQPPQGGAGSTSRVPMIQDKLPVDLNILKLTASG